MEKVIFRKEYDPYREDYSFLAIFPDDESRPGFLACVPFYPGHYGGIVWEAFDECSYGYYLETKRIRKNSPESEFCVSALKSRFGGDYKVMEKIMN